MSAQRELPTAIPDPSRITFLKALQRATGRPPVWLTVSALTNLLAVVAALPWLGWLRGVLDHRYAPGSVLRAFDGTFLFDHRASHGAISDATAATGAALAFLAVILGVFSAGGWLQVLLERSEGHTLRRFFYGGSRFFFRFLRVLLLTLLSLQLATYVCYGLPWKLLVEGLLLGVKDLEELDSELVARQVVLAQDGLYFLAALLILLWGDYTRARIALHDGVSALWAGLCTWITLIRHPVRTIRPYAFLALFEVLALLGAWQFTLFFDAGITTPGDWLALLGLLAVGQLLLLWRCIVRGARYAAAVEISAQLIRAPRRPDPWKQAVGGPGGPQYPIGGDEYAVSL
jgi:hypothetical protein